MPARIVATDDFPRFIGGGTGLISTLRSRTTMGVFLTGLRSHLIELRKAEAKV